MNIYNAPPYGYNGIVLNPSMWTNDPTFSQTPLTSPSSVTLPLNDIEDCSYLDANMKIAVTSTSILPVTY